MVSLNPFDWFPPGRTALEYYTKPGAELPGRGPPSDLAKLTALAVLGGLALFVLARSRSD